MEKSDNELIADFLGLGWHDNGTVSHYPTVLGMRMGTDTKVDLKFHTSWDWLMPVVEKIDNTYDYDRSMHDTVVDLPISTPIDEVYKAVVEFIRWYNSQPKI